MVATIKRRIAPAEPPGFESDIEPLLSRLLHARGLSSDADISLSMADLLKPELQGIDTAVSLLEDSLINQSRIVVVGDFDCDGATSCALFMRVMAAFGHQDVRFIVPNRFEYGYGLTPEIVDEVFLQSPELIVTVDNGIASESGVARAKEKGVKVLITDHHLPGDNLPEADSIVNPNQPGCEFESKNLAGVGVVFYLLMALRARLREKNWFAERTIAEPNLASYLDLVALGTVADVVPLDRNNRILVEQGLRRIRSGRCCEGIKSLLMIAGRSFSNVVASDLGFVLGPRLNAAGRLDDISIGIALLLTDDPLFAQEIATELDAFNRDRRSIERGMKLEAEREVERLLSQKTLDSDAEVLPAGLCLFHADWHQGVVGIVASRIKERFHRPTICFARESDDPANTTLKGSARSIEGLHIRDALDLVSKRHPQLVEKFGGHAMAAGLTIEEGNLEAFSSAFTAIADELLQPVDLQKQLLSDGELSTEQISLHSAQLLKSSFPWGQSVPEPLFDGEFNILQQRLVGDQHLKLMLADGNNNQRLIDAIAFNIDKDKWPDDSIRRVRVAYSLDVNNFRGKQSVQLIVRQIEKR